ncbi:MAG: TIGR03546 family protein [Deltaproteobacteria bacterium]|nr:TIGR03546 family protein [Deltaproteobacteria bacterium]
MIWLKIVGTFIKVLKDAATPNQIAAGFTVGFAVGLTPGWPLQSLVLVFLLLLFNINLSMGIAGGLLASVISWLLDAPLDALGAWALTNQGFQGLYTTLYNNPFWMLTRFNNTLVMGSLLAWLIMALPLFILTRVGVVQFRVRLLPTFEKLKIVQLVTGSKLYGWYKTASQYRFW